MQALCQVLKIDFHYDFIFKRYELSYKVDTVLKIMTRARKMYQAIEMILTIIKLIEKLKNLCEYNNGINSDLLAQNETEVGDSADKNDNPALK